jgi:HAD superfamily phosphatase (TIGR01668 family)
MRLFRPSETVPSIFEIDFPRLYEQGKRAVIFDLDKTLGGRKPTRLEPRVVNLLERLAGMGFRIGVLTNRRRVVRDPVIEQLSKRYPLHHRARKPSKNGFLTLLSAMGVSPHQAVVVGDRRLTDIFGANRLAIHSIRVRPWRGDRFSS